jgi:HEAT repeat protein
MPESVEFHAKRIMEAKNGDEASTHIGALIGMKTPKAVKALAKALQHGDWRVAWQSAWALGQIKSPEAVPALIKGLKHKNADVARHSAKALGEIRDERAVPALIKALGHKNDNVVNHSAYALVKIGKPAVPTLIRALKYKNLDVAWRSAEVLVDIKDRRAVPALIKALERNNMIETSAWALGEIGGRKALLALMAHADHPQENVRIAVKNAIRSIREDKNA